MLALQSLVAGGVPRLRLIRRVNGPDNNGDAYLAFDGVAHRVAARRRNNRNIIRRPIRAFGGWAMACCELLLASFEKSSIDPRKKSHVYESVANRQSNAIDRRVLNVRNRGYSKNALAMSAVKGI